VEKATAKSCSALFSVHVIGKHKFVANLFLLVCLLDIEVTIEMQR